MEIPILPQLSTPGFFLLFLVAPTDPQFHSVEGGTGAFTAAISRRFDLLQLVIPASISLQCALLPLFLWLRPTPLGPLSFWGSLAGATPRSGSADRFFLRCKPR